MSTHRQTETAAPTEEGVSFFPYHMLKEVVVIYLALGLALALVALAPPVIREPADPYHTPPHIKPEWYFLAMYQVLKLFPAQMPVLSHIPGVRAILGEGRAFSILLQGAVIVAVILLPFWDRNPERNPRRRPFMLTAGVVAFGTAIFLAVLAHVS